MKKQLLTALAAATVSMTAMAQAYIPNAGFETWASQLGEDQQPTGWVSYNVFTASLIDPSNQNQTSVTQAGAPDNYQGTYSAKIETVSLAVNPDATTIPNTAGILMTGTVAFSSPYLRPGYATQQRPMTFSYATKYTPANGDSAFCLVALTHWNSATSTRDTVAFGYDLLPNAIAAYSVRTITLTYLQANMFPDTAAIFFSASTTTNPQVGSALWVDALSFTGYVGIDEHNAAAGVDVYPNPSNNVTNFDVVDANAAFVVAYDMTGREVKRTMIYNKKGSMDVQDLSTGAYTYTILDKEGNVMSRGKFSVTE